MIALLDETRLHQAAATEVRDAIARARAAQHDWANRSTRERARLIGSLRPLLAEQSTELARVTAAVHRRPLAEKLVSEVLPLLAAASFLEKNAERILRPRRHGWAGRPLWLHGASFEIQRKPFGVVLIVGPSNYPLFIPAVQMLHALAAGNAVVIKPAESASAPLQLLLEQVVRRSSLTPDLVQILPESPQAARDAVSCGVDKAIFTGSSENGRDFLAELATQNIPSVMELSGADIVYARADAEVERAAKAIAFGLRLNGGNTCMAPHTIVVHESVHHEMQRALRNVGLAQAEIVAVSNDAEALTIAAESEHGLGAAIFSRDEAAARAFAQQLATGFVTINDLIVPTADPRLPFGGVRGSGFGVTRGAEGLLEMTYPHCVSVRRGRFLPHLDAPQENDTELFASYIALTHGRGLRARVSALRKLVRLARGRMR